QRHQDGRTLLAMRRVLKRAKVLFPKLQGTLLIGAFPEAMLVRRWVWKRGDKGEVTIGGVKYNCKQGTCPSADYVRIVPELISHRADLVLADLNGKWEDLYVEKKTELESIEAIPQGGLSKVTNGATITSTKFDVETERFEDFFWLKDDRYTILENGQKLKMRIYTGLQNPELASSDKNRKNPIAHPDIFVARINAKNVSHFPDKTFKDRRGEGFLDANGQPQILYTSAPIEPTAYLKRNITFERDLLVEYLDRNHAFRVGGNPKAAHRTVAVSHGDGLESAGSMNSYLRKASGSFNGSLATNNADLREYVAFLKQPAVLKGIVAHSGPWSSTFAKGYSSSALSGDVGRPWRWRKSSNGNTYLPSFMEQDGKADAYLYRTIHANDALGDIGGSLFIHNGCQVNSPGYAAKRRYNQVGYASEYGFQNAESLLFFTNAVGIASRAKVFYDKPKGMTAAMRTGHFGDGWKAYFTKESNDQTLLSGPASAKRAYTWSLNGDWTLNVRARNGLGIVSATGNSVKGKAVHPNAAWIGAHTPGGTPWMYYAPSTKVVGQGRFGGTRDEFVVQSNWGIGVVHWDGHAWQTRVAKKIGSMLNLWKYTSTDKVVGVADFDGDGAAEIALRRANGSLGIFDVEGSTLKLKLVKLVGARLGGWTLAKSDKVVAVGDFNGDGSTDLVIRSANKIFGLALLNGKTLQALALRPNNASLGGWTTRHTDVIEGVADTDGDGKSELVVRSSWGIGILKLTGSVLQAAVAKPSNSWFGQWRYNPAKDRVRAIGDFNGDGKDDLVVTSPWGIGILKRSGSSLTSLAAKPNNTMFGSWRLNSGGIPDAVLTAADLTGNGKANLVVRSKWGTGILRLLGSTLTTIYSKPHSTRLGAWHMSKDQKLVGVGNFDGTGAQDLLFAVN
ncbi:MAG: FG-GAP repeat domain-containing protein, partial [Nannocystaceae bacterium]